MGRAVGAVTLGLTLLWSRCEAAPQPRDVSPLAASARGTTYRSATGTLASYDAISRVLVLRAAGAESRYWVAEDARVWLGSSRVPVSQLGAHIGSEATLAYGEAEDGTRTTHTIRLREGHPR
jgi:hypothetical protein